MMKKTVITLICALLATCFAGSRAYAQQILSEDHELADTASCIQAARVDETLVGMDIYDLLRNGKKGRVSINEPASVTGAMRNHVAGNGGRQINGYRVRIFFDNRQTARNDSEATLKAFESRYPEHGAYRSYANPYFKVTVGDFRTKSEAMQLLQKIQGEFPSAFIVKESINYPIVDKNHSKVTL